MTTASNPLESDENAAKRTALHCLRFYRGHTVPRNTGPYYAFLADVTFDKNGDLLTPGDWTAESGSKPGEWVWGYPDAVYFHEDVFELIIDVLDRHISRLDPYGNMPIEPNARLAIAAELRRLVPIVQSTATRADAKRVLHDGFQLREFAPDPWSAARDALCETLTAMADWLEHRKSCDSLVVMIGI